MAARARSGGDGSGYGVALTIFVALFVVSTILAIVFFTKISTAEQEATKVSDDLREYVSNAEKNSPDIKQIISEARTDRSKTVIGLLMDKNNELTAELRNAEQLNDQNQSDIRTRDSEIERLQNELTQTQERLAAAENERDNQSGAYQDKYKQMLDDFESLESETAAYRKKADDAATDVSGQFADLRNRLENEKDRLESDIMQMTSQVNSLKRRIADLEQGRTREDVVDPSLLPDGIIVSVPNEENLVFINLARKDQILLGQTFEVYDDPEGIVRNKYNELEGKATIEVVQIGETASLARIVEIERGAIVSEGNYIANLIYDPEMTFKFRVFGEFDIDNLGTATARDRQRIETMIRNWNAQLVDELNYDTDFLILGVAPQQPAPLAADEFDPVKIERWKTAQQKLEIYNQLVNEAKALKIPVLNQNRFLTMIGYYHR